jgi:hypothetical protein
MTTVALTISKRRTFKFLRWAQLLNRLVDLDEILYWILPRLHTVTCYCCVSTLSRNNAILSDATIMDGLGFHCHATMYQAVIDFYSNEFCCLRSIGFEELLRSCQQIAREARELTVDGEDNRSSVHLVTAYRLRCKWTDCPTVSGELPAVLNCSVLSYGTEINFTLNRSPSTSQHICK